MMLAPALGTQVSLTMVAASQSCSVTQPSGASFKIVFASDFAAANLETSSFGLPSAVLLTFSLTETSRSTHMGARSVSL